MKIPTFQRSTNRWQQTGRYLLGLFMLVAGITHLTISRQAFQAQVPDWVPISKDMTVLLSGIVEIILGMSLIFWVKRRVFWGWATAVFLLLVFPGNISQYINHRAAFGLTSDLSRGIRLLFQPLLMAWSLWSTGAWNPARRGTVYAIH